MCKVCDDKYLVTCITCDGNTLLSCKTCDGRGWGLCPLCAYAIFGVASLKTGEEANWLDTSDWYLASTAETKKIKWQFVNLSLNPQHFKPLFRLQISGDL